jgi:hypothetical protein
LTTLSLDCLAISAIVFSASGKICAGVALVRGLFIAADETAEADDTEAAVVSVAFGQNSCPAQNAALAVAPMTPPIMPETTDLFAILGYPLS